MTKSSIIRLLPRLGWLVFAGLLLADILLRPFGELRSAQLVGAAMCLSAFLAGWVCMVVSGQPGSGGTWARGGWSLAGTGAFLLALSQAAQLATEFGLARTPALAACVTFSYLAAYPAFLLGAVLLAFAHGRGAGLRPLADALCALGGLALASWYWILAPIADELRKKSPLAALVGVFGPLVDLEVAFAAFLLLYLPCVIRSTRVLAAGLLMVALGNSILAFGTHSRVTTLLPWSELTGSLGLLLIALAPLLCEAPSRSSEEEAAPAESPWSWRATLGVVAVGAVTLASVSAVLLTEWHRNNHGLTRHVGVVCFALVGLTLAQQVFSVVAHGHASNRLHGSNQALEETVAARTRQLQVLHEILRAATSSLNVNEVLGQILRSTTQALSADATAIWLLEESQHGYQSLRQHAQSGFDKPEHRALLDAIPPRWGRGLEKMLEERQCVPVACEARDEADTRAEVWCAPLHWRGRTMGVLGAARWQGSLGRTERSLLQAVALEVAVALQNARLYHVAVEAADHDGVTGLLNHRAIVQQAGECFRHSERTGQPLAVILADLDNFKRINDTHGHLCGDQILKTVAEVLRQCCREGDLAGRYGGDEFILLCPGLDVDGARQLAETIKERFSETFLQQPGGGTLPICASFGVAIAPQMAGSQHELLALADMNLYESKARGAGTIVGLDESEASEPLVAGSFSTLDALVTAVDNRDRYTRKHSEDVTEYSLMIARELGWSEETLRTLRIAGLLHDLGKIAIPDSILRKPGALTDDEYEIMKQHPVLGWLIVSAIPSLSETLPAIRHHHERWDGRGYPDSLSGEEIPAMGRLMAVADAFSAMTTDRPYRKGMPIEEAVRRLRENMGTQFDPDMAQAFLRALQDRGDLVGPAELAAAAGRVPAWVG
jgi:diguanylate cyclase (GGDEF)-like protein